MTDADGADAPPQAHIVHRTARRLRLKVPDKRYDARFFAALEERLEAIPRIESALATPHTASILLGFADGDGDAIAAAIDALEILSIARGDGRPTRRLAAMAPTPENAGRAFDAIRDAATDRRKLAFAVFVLLMIRRLLRGGYLAPALALLWLLYELWQGRNRR